VTYVLTWHAARQERREYQTFDEAAAHRDRIIRGRGEDAHPQIEADPSPTATVGRRRPSAIDQTVAAMVKHGWQIVLLKPRDKRPAGSKWTITSREEVVREHVKGGGNVGLICGPESGGVAVLDFDAPSAYDEMIAELGPLVPWVRTGSGKFHCYVRWEDGLPAKIRWKGETVGECQRGGDGRLQMVVCPPSVHPSGTAYTWLANASLEPLPARWREHLIGTNHRADSSGDLPNAPRASGPGLPGFVTPGDTRGTENAKDTWDGPPPDVILANAMKQPGASRRRDGSVKMQCRGCLQKGHDRHRDNARVGPDGRFGCALSVEHRRAIAEQLGVLTAAGSEATSATIAGVPESWVTGF